MNTLALIFQLVFFLALPITKEANPFTAQSLNVSLSPVSELAIVPIVEVTDEGLIQIDEVLINLKKFNHHLKITDSKRHLIRNRLESGDIIWEKTVECEARFVLPFLKHVQPIHIKGRTKINDFKDLNNLSLESEIISVEGINRPIIWSHLILEFHLLLIIFTIAIILVKRIKLSSFWAKMIILFPVIGPISFGIQSLLVKPKTQRIRN